MEGLLIETLPTIFCGSAVTGSQDTLRMYWGKLREGSSPFFRTLSRRRKMQCCSMVIDGDNDFLSNLSSGRVNSTTNARIAQWIEHFATDEGVVSSSLTSCTQSGCNSMAECGPSTSEVVGSNPIIRFHDIQRLCYFNS